MRPPWTSAVICCRTLARRCEENPTSSGRFATGKDWQSAVAASHTPADASDNFRVIRIASAYQQTSRPRQTDKIDSVNWIYWSLLSALFAGATAVLAKVGVAGVDSNLATAIRTTVILFFTWAVAAITAAPSSIRHLPSRAWLFLVLSGLATGLSWLCYFRALQLGEASRVAPVDKLSVAFVILFAALFLGERLTIARGAGGLLIMAGAIILAME